MMASMAGFVEPHMTGDGNPLDTRFSPLQGLQLVARLGASFRILQPICATSGCSLCHMLACPVT